MRNYIAGLLISDKIKGGISLVYDVLSAIISSLESILGSPVINSDLKIRLETLLRAVKVVRDFIGKILVLFGIRPADARHFSSEQIHALCNRLESV